MNYTGHLLVGFCLCLLCLYFIFPNYLTSQREGAVFILVGTISALIPDLDHPKSKGTKIINFSIFILIIIFSYSLFLKNTSSFEAIVKFLFFIFVFYFTWLGISNMIRPKHRGITHSFLALIIYSIILYFIFGIIFLLAGVIGYFSHLLADKCFKLI